MTHKTQRLALACLAIFSQSLAFAADPLNIHVKTVISGIQTLDYPEVVLFPEGGGLEGSQWARDAAAAHFQNGQSIALDITLDTSVIGKRTDISTDYYTLTYTGALQRMQATVENTGETFNMGYWPNPSQTVALLVNTQNNMGYLSFQGNKAGDAPVLVSDTQANAPVLYLSAGTGMLPALNLPVSGDGNYSLQGAGNWLSQAAPDSDQIRGVTIGLSSDCHPKTYFCASGTLTRTALSVSGVPETSTWSLMGLGLLGMAGVVTSRRRAPIRT